MVGEPPRYASEDRDSPAYRAAVYELSYERRARLLTKTSLRNEIES